MTFVDHSGRTRASIYIMPGAGGQMLWQKSNLRRNKRSDRTGINQNRHKHGRTVPRAQRPPADVSYLETEIHGIWQGSVNPSVSAVSDQVSQSLSAVCLSSTFQIKHGFVYPQTMKKERIDRKSFLKTRHRQAQGVTQKGDGRKAWDILPAKGILMEPENAASSGQI